MRDLSNKTKWPYPNLKFDAKYGKIHDEGYEDAKSGKPIMAPGGHRELESLNPYDGQGKYESYFYYLGHRNYAEFVENEDSAA